MVWAHPLLRAFAIQTTCWQLLNHMLTAILVLFATRELGLSAAQLGLGYTLGGVGSLVAALTAERLGERFGVGPMVAWGFAATALAWLGVGLVPVGAFALAGFCLCRALLAFGATMFSIHYLSARAAVTPDDMLGRMIATMRFFTVAPAPLGALAGGLLGTLLGLRGALHVVGLLGVLLTLHAMLRSPARQLIRLPVRHLASEPG
jgi:MFS family permease